MRQKDRDYGFKAALQPTKRKESPRVQCSVPPPHAGVGPDGDCAPQVNAPQWAAGLPA
jgi:hypothetical protein